MPLVIAHRGASAEAPENTLAAIRRAIELGANGIELDILLSKDGVPIVTHNNKLSILTSHQGFAHLTPWSVIRELDVGKHFGKTWEGERIPHLTEALLLIAAHDLEVILELKYQPGNARHLVRTVLETVRNVPLCRPVIFASFSLGILRALKYQSPESRRAIIFGRGLLTALRATKIADLIAAQTIMASLAAAAHSKLRSRIRADGRQLYLWTINTPHDLTRALRFGADAIITDQVVMVQKLLRDRFK